MNDIYAALEIGTTRTVLAVAEMQPGGRLKAMHAEIPSTGVRKSQILDISQATQSIRSVLHETEKRQEESGAKLTLGNAFLVVSGQHIRADASQQSVSVDGGKVRPETVDDVLAKSREAAVTANDRELLDIVDQDFIVDTLGGIADPKGMSGRILGLNTLQIHAERNRIQDARTAAETARLEIREPVFACTCAADAVLEDYEKKNGALVLDLGGGSTGYAVYTDGYLLTTGVLGVGGDHVTNDIAHAFQTTNAQAEQLKIETASALVGAYSGEETRVRVSGSSPLMETRTISRRALDTVVNVRLKELFAMIREQLEEQDLLHRLHAGVILTGGGANLRDIDALAAQELMTNVRRGRPTTVDGFEDAVAPWSFAAVAGALLYARRSDGNRSFLGGLIRRFF